MPLIVSQNAELYWEEHGSGEPVLMVMGLSFTLDMWYRLRPSISSRYRTILFDNRGVGRSSTPPGPYSMRMMAEDACAVLDAAGVVSAYVLGASMGGMIAQELCLRHPHRVRALLLGCTGPSGFRSQLPRFSRLGSFGPAISFVRERREWWLSRLLYADTTPRERIAEDIAVRLKLPQRPLGIASQLAAIVTWSSYSRLPRIQVPTLVLHGDRDAVVPLSNGRLLATRIPSAKLVVIPGAGHVLTTDALDLVEQETLGFLQACTSRGKATGSD